MKLYICEKPSQARDLAHNLNISGQGDGYIGNNDIKVTWGIGHLVQLLDPNEIDPKYASWNLDHLPIISHNWEMKPNPKTKKQLNVIGKLLKQTNHVIIATDGDREGETIGRELLDYFNWSGYIERLWLTALDDSSIQKSLKQLKTDQETKPLYFAGLARSRADWLVGMNLTRLMTMLAQQQGNQGVLSIGRVQTPTLSIVVNRDLEIENFKSKDYFDIIGNFDGIEAKWQPSKELGLSQVDEQGRCIDKQIAKSVINQLANQTGSVSQFETKRQKVVPPLLYSLSKLQQDASAKFGYGAKQVLDIAQALYEKHKATTYPRTDCQYLPESQHSEVNDVLNSLVKSDNQLSSLVDNAEPSKISKVFNDKKISAHHGIIPTTKIINIKQLSEAEFNLYDLIRRKFIAQFYPNYEYDKTNIVIVNNEIFNNIINIDKVIGWKEVINPNYQSKTTNLPNLGVGQQLHINSLDLQTKQTKPPARYTEGTLIAAMEKAHLFVADESLKKILKGNEGIGTEATRANIIDTLIKRKFIITKKKQIVSTNTGRSLIATIPNQIKDPGMTAIWELSLEKIANGELSLQDFMNWQTKWISDFVVSYKDKKITMSGINSKSYPCPNCQKNMFLRSGKKGQFWACSGYPDCKTTAQDNNGKPSDPAHYY